MMNTPLLKRYEGNRGLLTPQQQQELLGKRVCIVGCGGLGGYAASFLARFGLGHLTLVDGDVFSASNLNRQQFSTEENLGRNKAVEGKRQLALINSTLSVEAVPIMVTDENAQSILTNHHLVLDCLDNLPTRFLLEDYCEKLSLPLVHGGLGGWYGQVANIFPGEGLFHKIYPHHKNLKTLEKKMGTPTFTPALVASIQVSEAVKILTNNPHTMRKTLLHMDLLDNEFTEIPL